jgi:hypothetical protein
MASLESARRAAEEALEHFGMLGGSADRAQSVIDLIEDLHREATGLDGRTDEIGTALDAVDHAITPEENIAELDGVTERVDSCREALGAVVDACDAAIDQTHEDLAGSARADDIAGRIEEARDDLDQGRTALDGLAAEILGQQEAFRGSLTSAVGTFALPGPGGAAEAARHAAEAELADVDQPLENPRPNASSRGHGHARHGHQTTDPQQAERIRTGVAPDGLPAKTSRASRFRSPEAELDALARARQRLAADLRSGEVEHYVDGTNGEIGYVDPGNGEPSHHALTVETSDPRGFGEVAYVPRRTGGPGTAYDKDAAGNRIPQEVAGPFKKARVVFEYVPSAHEWRVLTYYPEA